MEARGQKKPLLNMYLLTFGSPRSQAVHPKEQPGNLPKFKLLTLLPWSWQYQSDFRMLHVTAVECNITVY